MSNNNPQQNENNNAKNQFSNSEPLTHAQKVEYIKNVQMTNDKQQTTIGIVNHKIENIEWVFQFNNDNPIIISKPIGGEKELTIKLNNTHCSNLVFDDGKGNTFKIFAREQTL